MEQEKCNKSKIPYFRVAADFKEMEQNDREYYRSLTDKEYHKIMMKLMVFYLEMKNLKLPKLDRTKFKIVTFDELNQRKIGE